MRVNIDSGIELQRQTLPFQVVHAHAAPCAENLNIHTKQIFIVDSTEKVHPKGSSACRLSTVNSSLSCRERDTSKLSKSMEEGDGFVEIRDLFGQ